MQEILRTVNLKHLQNKSNTNTPFHLPWTFKTDFKSLRFVFLSFSYKELDNLFENQDACRIKLF